MKCCMITTTTTTTQQHLADTLHQPSIYHVLVSQYHHNDAIDENDILVFALSLIRAVQKLHAIGIIHCDIKPSNILWDTTQKMVRLIDFEHAQDEDNARWYTTTSHYEAPEISQKKPHTTNTMLKKRKEILTRQAGKR